MLTGDNERTARAITEAVGVDDFRAELLPEDKMRAVEDLVDEDGAVAMVGDGINDAPALAAKALLALGVSLGYVTVAIAVLVGDVGMTVGVTGNAMRLSRIDPESFGAD